MEPNGKPHLVCIPMPAQSHIKAMINLAKLLHSRGFYITLVLTEFDFARLVASSSIDASLQTLHDFTIETIPDGLPPENARGGKDLLEMFRALPGEPKKALRALLKKLLVASPITSIISDGFLHMAREVGQELGIQVFLLFTISACALLGFIYNDELVKRGILPIKDESYLINGDLDTPIDCIPGLIKGAKLKHISAIVQTTDPNDTTYNFVQETTKSTLAAQGIIINTFDDLETKALEAIKTKIPNNLYTIGPLSLLFEQVKVQELLPFRSNLWKEDTNCLDWLDKRSPKSVIYVNYGSLTILTTEQFAEFAWGLANSKHSFLWAIRPDLVEGGSSIITQEYMKEIEGRGLLSGWCPQEEVLKHPSVAVFLTHCGWNSTLESISEGVPMICWPFMADQRTNSLYASQEWRVGMDMEVGDVRREKVELFVREMMEGEKGEEVKGKVMEWKRKLDEAIKFGGSSNNNFDKLVRYLMSCES